MPEGQRSTEHAHAEQMEFVEEIARLMEELGLPRIGGRILGWLTICDPPHQSFNDLVAVLGASKGSVSGVTQRLLDRQLVERITLPGERQTYFRLRPDAARLVTARQQRILDAMTQAAERGLAVAARTNPTGDRRRLEEMRDLSRFFARRYPVLLEEFERERAGRADEG